MSIRLDHLNLTFADGESIPGKAVVFPGVRLPDLPIKRGDGRGVDDYATLLAYRLLPRQSRCKL
mgnify:CR=1 FL=1